MANRYANLVGSNKIKDEWQKINTGFDLVQQDVDKLQDEVEYIDDRVDQIISDPTPGKDPELVDIRTPDPSYTPLEPISTAGDVTRDMQKQFVENALKRDGSVWMDDHLTFSQALRGLRWITGQSNVTCELADAPDVADGDVTVRLFRHTNTTGMKRFQITRGGTAAGVFEISNGSITRLSDANVNILAGAESPEGNITAPPGSLYLRTTGELYVKKTGTGNTGWGQVNVS